MDVEEWKIVDGWELYEVSNLGRIRNAKSGTIKMQQMNNRKYKVCQFEMGKRKQTNLVHRIVGFAFCLKKDEFNVINHIDGNQLNNNSKNLEWCNQKHNVHEAIRMGFFDPKEHQRKSVLKRKK